MTEPKITVVIVTDTPQLHNPEIQSGIRNKEEATSWAKKRGYLTVYLFQKRERIYADKLSMPVHAAAKSIEQKSRQLLQEAES